MDEHNLHASPSHLTSESLGHLVEDEYRPLEHIFNERHAHGVPHGHLDVEHDYAYGHNYHPYVEHDMYHNYLQ
jgi:hypothetical protein